MDIETININDIHPAQYNPRQIQPEELTKLEKGLNNFGLVSPIIIDLTDNNTVIGGHQRLKALQNLHVESLKLIRMGDIGWVFSDDNLKIKDKNDQKALNLALNRISGEFTDQLREVMVDLTQSGYDTSLTGFDDYEVIELELDDVELKLEADNNSDDTNNTTSIYLDTRAVTINFGTLQQRQDFLKFIEKRDKNIDITTHILNYMKLLPQNDENVPVYTITLTQEQYQQYKELSAHMEQYHHDPLIGAIYENRQ